MKLTLTNQLQDAGYNLNITKQDAEDKTKLGGVELKLEKLLDNGNLIPNLVKMVLGWV